MFISNVLRVIKILLSATLATSLTLSVHAAGDIGQAASMAGMLGMVVLATSGNDIGRSYTNCTSVSSARAQVTAATAEVSTASAGLPWTAAAFAAANAHLATATSTLAAAEAKDKAESVTSGGCLMVGLNVAAMAAAVIPMFTSSDTGGAVAGGGSVTPAGVFDPNIPLATQMKCPPNQAGCDCTAPGSEGNPLCGKDAMNNVRSQLANLNAGLKSGAVLPPDGQSADDAIAGNDKALGILDSMLDGNLGAIETASLGDLAGSGKTGGGGKGGEIIGGGFDPVSGSNGKAGPQDRSGLGKISLINGLDAIDDATGKQLTLWQRNTRRQQGDEKGTRAFLMAKVEFIRKQASKANKAAELAKAAPAAPTKAPAPASTEVRRNHKLNGRH